MTAVALACDMTAVPPEERPGHAALARGLFADRELEPAGEEGLRTTLDAAAFEELARWIRYERLCCPFLRFTIDVAPAAGAITLTLSGPPGTRAFLESEIGS